MDILEQPLDAVAFRIHSLPEAAAAGAAAWTCLAVLAAAAAAGVWRLRSSTAPSTVITDDESNPLGMDASPPLMSLPEAERSLALGRSSEMTSSSLPALSPRERYTAYYHDGGCVGCCDVESDDEEEMEEDRDPEDDIDGVYGPPEADPFEWEVVRPLVLLVAATTADTARRYKSPRALGCSVVRLWDQGADRMFTASARPRGRAATVSSF